MTLKELIEEQISLNKGARLPLETGLEQAILTWLKDDIVPEEKKDMYVTRNDKILKKVTAILKAEIKGHNSCRSTMLKRLEGDNE